MTAPQRPGPADLELVGAAVSALLRPGRPAAGPAVLTAAAVRTGSGRVVAGLGLAGCAEPVAVGAALAAGESPVTLVAVRHVDADRTVVTEPCPACLRLLREHVPGVRVLHLADGLRVAGLAGLPAR